MKTSLTKRTAYLFLITGLMVSLIAAIIISTGMGFMHIHPAEVLRIIAGKISGCPEFSHPQP